MPSTLSLSHLQQVLCHELKLPANTMLNIRQGFPPRQLLADKDDDKTVVLSEGDRLAIDIVATNKPINMPAEKTELAENTSVLDQKALEDGDDDLSKHCAL